MVEGRPDQAHRPGHVREDLISVKPGSAETRREKGAQVDLALHRLGVHCGCETALRAAKVQPPSGLKCMKVKCSTVGHSPDRVARAIRVLLFHFDPPGGRTASRRRLRDIERRFATTIFARLALSLPEPRGGEPFAHDHRQRHNKFHRDV